MTDVFISYAHDDQLFVSQIAHTLQSEGFSVWWDHSIPPGQTWDSHIARGIKEARACIVVWSQHAIESDWVKEEASIAREAGKYLPAQIDGVTPPIGFSRIQAAKLGGWNGDRHDTQWRMLVGELQRMVEGGEIVGYELNAKRPVTPLPRRSLRIAAVAAAIAIAAGFVWYANSPAWPPIASLRHADNSQSAEKRSNVATNARVEPESMPPTLPSQSVGSRPVNSAQPAETAFERRDRIEREIRATGIVGRWVLVGGSSAQWSIERQCSATGYNTLTGGSGEVSVVGDNLTLALPPYGTFIVSNVDSGVISGTNRAYSERGEARLLLIDGRMTMEFANDSSRAEYFKCR
jgi:hypothetical protein